jgi:DNA-binding NarL/FixJ family response regulator
VVAATPAGDTRWEVLAEALAGALFLLGREERAEAIASRLLEVTSEPGRRARVTWTLAFALLNQGLPAQALAVLGQALAGPAVPSRWAVRLRSIRALALLNDGQNSDARTQAQAALTEAEQADDRFAACYALSTLINLRLYDNDLRGALQLAEQALAKMGDDPELTDLRLLLMRNRLVLLSRLDPGIRGGAREVLALAERVGTARIGLMRWHLAVDLFDAGQWDDALAELAPMFESGPAASKLTVVACHGLAALIAAHRDDRAALNHHLAAVGHLPDLRPIDLVNVADLTRARALAEERADRSGAAAAMLAPAMRPDFGVDPAVRTYWLAGLVRCALAAGDEPAAREAAQQCEQTAHESQDATLMAIGLRCRGLADADPARLTEAVARLRQVHRPLELAEALEDLAVVCGSRDESVPARAALREAVDLYTGLGADWDILRADARTRPFGVRRGRPGTRRRPASGWDALTSTELKIAYLVAEGLSNPDIGARMFVSWRTVRTHISSIMAKLGVHSRLEIARETDRHPAA